MNSRFFPLNWEFSSISRHNPLISRKDGRAIREFFAAEPGIFSA